jgi:hypothetical protein
LLKFLLLYVGKLGFLDGKAGFIYATLQSFYEYMIVLKTKELTVASDALVRDIEIILGIQSQTAASRGTAKGLDANTGSND